MRTLVRALFCLALVGPASLTAQEARIQGRIVDGDVGRPLQGVLVHLLDDEGAVLQSRLTSPSGSFVFPELNPGEYTIAADMIGYAEGRTDLIRLGDGEMRTVQLGLEISAIQLAGLDVSGERRCRLDPTDGQILAHLWTEIREALERASFTGGVPFAYEVEEFERRLSRNLRSVFDEDRSTRLIVSGVPFVSIDPEILGERGYALRSEATGRIDFYGPDADVLLSDEFSESHCFDLQEGDGENEGLLGLGFEPVDGREVPDIEGVLWVDPGTMRLSHVEYRYRNLLNGPREQFLGGRVEYTHLPNGLWIIGYWELRAPIVTREALDEWSPERPRFAHNDLAMVHEVGGRVKLVRDPDGEPILDADAGLVRGIVETGATGEPVMGLYVKLGDTGRVARTNEAGEFRFTDVPEGSYLLYLEDGEGRRLSEVEERAAPGVQSYVRFLVGG